MFILFNNVYLILAQISTNNEKKYLPFYLQYLIV